MLRRRVGGVVSLVVVFAAAACSGGSDADPVASVTAPTTTGPPFTTSNVEPPSTTTPGFADGPLAEVCGDTIIVQASSFPDVGTGPLYSLLGADPTVDVDRQVVSGPLTRADGTVEAVTLEIRSGGPSVGFRSPIAVMADDQSIHIADASTAIAVRDRSLLATQAVMTLTDRSRDAVIIDPATYPDITDIALLGAENIEVRHVTDAPVITFLTAAGVLTPDQLTPGSDELPASFVGAGGAMAQQGDLTVEPALLPALPQWGRPVVALPASAAGWSSLDDMLVVDSATDRLSEDCLGRVVRVVQQSIVAYVADPSATNVVMSNIRAQFNPLARLTPALLDEGTRLAIDAGVFDTTRTDAPGTIDPNGFEVFLADLASALQVEPVTIDELFDPRFVDSTISR
jgi:hypothetical protein